MKCSEVMTRDPVCCLPEDTIQQAALLMTKRDVGSLPVVVDDATRTLVGVISDRDIVVRLVAEGKDCARERIGRVMTRDPISCRPDESLEEAIHRMTERQVRRIPVVDSDNRVVGIIAQADVATRSDEESVTAELVREVSQ